MASTFSHFTDVMFNVKKKNSEQNSLLKKGLDVSIFGCIICSGV